MARRASLSAGTSLTPSPTIATYRPASASASTTARLPSGEIRPTAGADRTASRSAAGSDGQRLAVERRRRARARRRRGRSRRPWPARRPRAPSSSTPWAVKKATVSAALGRSRSASTTRPSGRTSSGNGGSAPSSGSGASVRPSASTRRPGARLLAGALGERGVGVGEPLRRPQHEPLVAEIERAPATPRGERHLGDDRAWRRRPPARRRRSPPGSGCETARWRRSVASSRASDRLVRAGRGTSPTTRSVGSVSVPVLSVQTMSTEASDSIALSCCASTPALRHLERRHRRGDADQQDQSLGDEVDDPGRDRLHARGRGLGVGEHRDRQPDRERDRRARPATAAAGRWLARAASADDETRARSRSAARRGCPRRRRWPRTAPPPSTANEPDHTGSPAPRTASSDSPVRLDSSSASPSADTSVPSATTWSPAARRTRSPTTTWSTGTRRSTPSRTTTASGATSAASRSSARLERISWKDPIAMFETRIPTNSASRHDANTIVSTPKTSRIPLGIVSVLARTMLA